MKIRTAALNRSTSKLPSSHLNFIRLSDAKLQAVLSRERYSEHGFVGFCRAVPLPACHRWMVLSNCIPGPPQTGGPSPIFPPDDRPSLFSPSLPPPPRP